MHFISSTDSGEIELTIRWPCPPEPKSKQDSWNPGKCKSCASPNMICLLCSLPVRGMATLCHVCGHGGHLGHLQEWFLLPQSNQLCAAPGCGCPCLKYLTEWCRQFREVAITDLGRKYRFSWSAIFAFWKGETRSWCHKQILEYRSYATLK